MKKILFLISLTLLSCKPKTYNLEECMAEVEKRTGDFKLTGAEKDEADMGSFIVCHINHNDPDAAMIYLNSIRNSH